MTTTPNPEQLVAEALGCAVASLTGDSRLGNHPNWDSVGHLTVMLALERHYGVTLSDETIRRYDSLAAIREAFGTATS